ncbi:MAG: carbohydrate ABC transporter substrate-binding protein [Oscillospiraceae bacterium]|nr:carbohydrate ABC transporter substrate-binding protein [Oscillospiraceae bacterium]
MKKFLALVLALTMVIALAACGVSTESAAPAAAPAGDSQAAAPAAAAPAGNGIRLFNGKIEIAEPLEHAAKAYEEATGKHVEVESLGGGVDLQATLKQYYQAGNMPDIFVFEGAPDLANWTGMVVDMSDQDWAKDTDAGFVSEEGLVGFPYTTEAIGLAYNKSILDKAGVDPKSITGPESMKAAFEAIDAKKDELGITAVIGYCANATELYWSTGQHLFGQYLDAGLARDDTTYFDMMMNEGKLDHDRFTHFAEMVDLFNHYSDPALLVSGNYDMQVSGFAAGKYAFVTQGSWIGSSLTNQYKDQYAAAGNFECGYVPYCFEEGIDTILTNAPSHWAVYKDGNVAEAEAFLSWLAGPDGQQIMVQEAGCVSPFKSCTVVANDPFAGPVSEYAAAGKTSSWHWMGQPSNMAQDGTGAIFQDFAMGTEDVASFVEAMESVIPDFVK